MRFLLLYMFICSAVYADEASQFNFSHSFYETSQHINIHTTSINWKNNRRDMSWAYEGAEDSATDYGVSLKHYTGESKGFSEKFSGNKLEITGGRKISKILGVDGSIGVHAFELDRAPTIKKTEGVWMLGITLVPVESLYTRFSIDHDSMYQLIPYGPGNSQDYTAETFTFNLTWRAHNKFIIRHVSRMRKVSDSNQSIGTQTSFLYGISENWPWIWAGPFVEYLGHKKNSLPYWSPNSFKNYGLTGEASFPIIERLSGVSALQLSRFQEDSLDKGTGYYWQLGLQYGNRNEYIFKLVYDYLRSQQKSSRWSAESLTLSYSQSF